MKICYRRLAAALCSAALLFTGTFTLTAGADAPGQTYNYDLWDEAVPSQAGYIAERSVSGADLGIKNFDEPSDIFCDNGTFYIADTRNDRIVTADSDLTSAVRVYTSFTMPDGTATRLNKP